MYDHVDDKTVFFLCVHYAVCQQLAVIVERELLRSAERSSYGQQDKWIVELFYLYENKSVLWWIKVMRMLSGQ